MSEEVCHPWAPAHRSEMKWIYKGANHKRRTQTDTSGKYSTMLQQTILLLCIGVALGKGTGQYLGMGHQQTSQQYAGFYSQHPSYPVSAAQSAAPSPYAFGYQAEALGGSSSRKEAGDASGKVTGSYSVTNEDGSARQVQYIADQGGFRAQINTNEPGTKSDNPADVTFNSAAPAVSYAAQAPAQKPVSYSRSIYQDGASYGESDALGQPSPYSFAYEAKGAEGSSSHQETSDGSGKVSGHYSLSAVDGRRRTVQYTADSGGFRAEVETNELGTKSDNPADVSFRSSAPFDAPAAAGGPLSYSSGANQPQSYYQPSQQPQAPALPFQYTIGSAAEGQPFPYSFNYQAQGTDGGSSRNEASDGSGKVTGSYSLLNTDGRKRTVDYTADTAGFRASIQTNEFGTKSDSPADVSFYSSAPQVAPAAHTPYKPSYQPQQQPQSYYQPSQQPQAPALPFQYTIGSAAEGQPFPYSFNYQAQGTDGGSSRNEASDGSGKVTGSYSLLNTDGRKRTVDYTADTAGFRASIQTNEFGTKSDSPADVSFYSSAPQVAPAAHTPYKPSYQPQQQIPLQYSLPISGGAPLAPSPYSFGYQAEALKGSSSRQETGDSSGKVTGSYSVTNEDGSSRLVEYTADAGGFKANVKTNEPGTKSDNPADVSFNSAAPQPVPHSSSAQFPARTDTPKSYYGFQGGQRVGHF